jgi:hypothetical protein
MRKHKDQALAWCWGAGWDSTAGIIEGVKRGIIPDLITFANTGGEKNVPDPRNGEQVGTYDFIPIFTEWLLDNGCPEPVICEYQPKDVTVERYMAAALETIDRLELSISVEHATNLAKLYGNMVANHTLPGIAFGPKSCSIKWKLEAQEPI